MSALLVTGVARNFTRILGSSIFIPGHIQFGNKQVRVLSSQSVSSVLKGRCCSCYGVTSSDTPLKPMTIMRRELTNDDVGIEIDYCGVCHSDLHWIRNEWKDSKYPMVPGHEIIGRICQVGSNVNNFRVGDKVGVGLYVDSCRHCDLCISGFGQHCSECVFVFNSEYSRDQGELTKGGFSTYIVADHQYVNRIPDSLDYTKAAPLLCAGVTVFTPMQRWQVGPGCKFAVNGLGGLGHMAVKLGVALGAEVTVLSHSDRKKHDAQRLGAHDFVITGQSPATMAHLKNRFDCILDTVTVPHDLDAILRAVKFQGVMMLVSIPEQPLAFRSHSIVFDNRCISGSLIGSVDDVQKVIDFSAAKNVTADVEFIKMGEINEALERMLHSQVRYRFVIDMSSLK